MNDLFARTRLSLVAWTILISAIILGFVGFGAYNSLSHGLLDEVDRDLVSRSDQAISNLRVLADEGVLFDREGYRGGTFVLVLGADYRVLANPQAVDAKSLLLQLPAAQPTISPADAPEGPSPSHLTVSLFDEPTRVYARPLRNAWLVVGKSLAPEQSALRQLLVVLASTGLIGLLLSVAGGWFLAGRALVPIAESFRRQREFIADAGHELRTPLTILRSTTDLLQQHRDETLGTNGELFDDARHEIVRLERLAGDLLTIAQSDQRSLSLAEADVDLPVLAGDLIRRLAPLAQARGVELAVRGEKSIAMVEGDPDRLEQVLLILLDNALKHTPPGGSVTITVRHQGSDVLTEVADTGEGIPTEHLPRVFDRFYRADRSRSRADGSTGLGLAIARSLVDAHRGRLSISSSPGNGTRVTIQLRAIGHASPIGSRLTGFAARLAHRSTTGTDPRADQAMAEATPLPNAPPQGRSGHS